MSTCTSTCTSTTLFHHPTKSGQPLTFFIHPACIIKGLAFHIKKYGGIVHDTYHSSSFILLEPSQFSHAYTTPISYHLDTCEPIMLSKSASIVDPTYIQHTRLKQTRQNVDDYIYAGPKLAQQDNITSSTSPSKTTTQASMSSHTTTSPSRHPLSSTKPIIRAPAPAVSVPATPSSSFASHQHTTTSKATLATSTSTSTSKVPSKSSSAAPTPTSPSASPSSSVTSPVAKSITARAPITNPAKSTHVRFDIRTSLFSTEEDWSIIQHVRQQQQLDPNADLNSRTLWQTAVDAGHGYGKDWKALHTRYQYLSRYNAKQLKQLQRDAEATANKQTTTTATSPFTRKTATTSPKTGATTTTQPTTSTSTSTSTSTHKPIETVPATSKTTPAVASPASRKRPHDVIAVDDDTPAHRNKQQRQDAHVEEKTNSDADMSQPQSQSQLQSQPQPQLQSADDHPLPTDPSSFSPLRRISVSSLRVSQLRSRLTTLAHDTGHSTAVVLHALLVNNGSFSAAYTYLTRGQGLIEEKDDEKEDGIRYGQQWEQHALQPWSYQQDRELLLPSSKISQINDHDQHHHPGINAQEEDDRKRQRRAFLDGISSHLLQTTKSVSHASSHLFQQQSQHHHQHEEKDEESDELQQQTAEEDDDDDDDDVMIPATYQESQLF